MNENSVTAKMHRSQCQDSGGQRLPGGVGTRLELWSQLSGKKQISRYRGVSRVWDRRSLNGLSSLVTVLVV